MYKKIVVLISCLVISGCKRSHVQSGRQQEVNHLDVSGLCLRQEVPQKKRIKSFIKPIEKMSQLADLIEEHFKVGYKPKDLLIIFDIDETLLASYVSDKDGNSKQFLAHDLYPFVADAVLLENIPETRLKEIGKENIVPQEVLVLEKNNAQYYAELIGFGTYTVVERKARIGRNPRTGEELKIPAKKTIKFKAGKGLREAVE